MSGIDILRRDGTAAGERDGPLQSKREARRSAFEANLALQLERTLGGEASLKDIEEITRVLGAAHQAARHLIDARTSIGVGLDRYFVLQIGAAPITGDSRIDSIDPYAAKLLDCLSGDALRLVEPRLKPVATALAKAEIARTHPMDIRLQLKTPWRRLYLTLLSGRDRRRSEGAVTHNRRAPADESLGLLILLTVIAVICILGVGMIVTTVWTFSQLLMDDGGRQALLDMLRNSLSWINWP